MKIVLAGSMAFAAKMQEVQYQLEQYGVSVTFPQDGGDASPVAIRGYNEAALRRISEADILLVVNETKHGIDGYVGTNTLIEIGMTFAVHKPIYLLNSYDETQPSASELAGLIDGIVGENVETWLQNIKEEAK